MLPGAYDTPDDFIAQGFDRVARDAGFAFRAVATDLTAVADGRLVHRVLEEVIAPARDQGFKRVLLGGISIGGLVAMTCADAAPEAVDGLVLIAPYPGNRSITRAISAAGGIRHWTPGDLATDDGELRGWRALKHLGGASPPAVWLGYGLQDRFAPGHGLMAEALSPCQVVTKTGGHDWPTWLALWQTMLTRINGE